MHRMRSSMDQYIGSQEAVASLMELRAGSGLDGVSLLRGGSGHGSPSRRLENIILINDHVHDLFRR